MKSMKIKDLKRLELEAKDGEKSSSKRIFV